MSTFVTLIGYPVSHSLSPAMHNAAFDSIGLDWRYKAVPVEPGRLVDAVNRVRQPDCAGANVTVPHKQAVVPLLDGLTPVAEAIGAVNTVFKRDGKLIGHNTDAAGLLADLYAHDVALAHRTVLIIGAGGAARAVVAACAGVGARLRVAARRREQAESLRNLADVEVFDLTPLGVMQASDGCALIVNATPIGMTPNINRSPWLAGTLFPLDAFAYDLVYNPPDTLFTQQARAAGLRAATGLGMLVEQGALAFELWTGQSAPRDRMRQAAEMELMVVNF
ncbi:MAG TPA: shikimate dehydrogenase [Anaerolineae bacterium]|nr:shikimate dehydrogenase [Anaerolineae bacterium]